MNLLKLLGKKPLIENVKYGDVATVSIIRGRSVDQVFRIGPNEVHAFITHADGDITDLGISHNLLTNAGRDLAAAALGHVTAKYGAFTATSATSGTPAGGGLSADAYKGYRVFCPISAITSAPVYGNIGSNSTTVLTVDQWWDGAYAAASTPASTNGYYIQAIFEPRFMGITADASAANAASTTLTSEQTANGLARAIATYAHSGGTATLTLQKAWSPSGTVNALHRIGLFTAKDTTAAGVICFEAVLNADANVVNGDTLTVTDTITLS
jgi:hypothetical protein